MASTQYQVGTSQTVVTFVSKTINTPITLEGFADASFDITPVKNVERTIGTDGKVKNAVYPVLVEGKVTFFAGSPSVEKINAILTAQTNTGTDQDAGTLTITNAIMGKTYVLEGFMWLNAPIIPSEELKGVKDVSFDFSYTASSNNVQNTLVTNLLNKARSIVGV